MGSLTDDKAMKITNNYNNSHRFQVVDLDNKKQEDI